MPRYALFNPCRRMIKDTYYLNKYLFWTSLTQLQIAFDKSLPINYCRIFHRHRSVIDAFVEVRNYYHVSIHALISKRDVL